MSSSDLALRDEDPPEARPQTPPVKEPRRVSTSIGILRELWHFIVRPRSFVARRKLEPERPAGALVVLAFSGAAFILLWGLYGLTLGSFTENTMRAQGLQPPPTAPAAEVEAPPSRSAPTIASWGFTPSLNFRLGLPEVTSRPTSSPQRVVFAVGAAYLVLDNVVPEDLSRGAFPFLILALTAVVFIACLYVPARFLGSRGTPAEALRISILYCAYTVLVLSALLIVAMLIVFHALGLRGSGFQVAMSLLQVPMLVLILRGYFASFAELFDFTKRRLALASAGAMFLSLVLSPALAFPAIYLMVRFQPLWDLFF